MTTANTLPSLAATHAGVFHADDVFGAALLLIINPQIEIARVQSANQAPDGALQFDIGCGRYDHHQPDAEVRPNGIKYAAFGLLWREFGHMVVPEQFVAQFDEQFVQPIDAADNGAAPTPIYQAIAAFNPNWDESITFDKQFDKAVVLAQSILERQIALYESKDNAEQAVSAAVDNSLTAADPAIVLDRYMPWQEAVFANPANTNFNYIIFPAVRGGYNVQAIPTSPNGRDQRKPFPADWVVNKPAGATFVHPGRFLVATVTIEDALCIAEAANKEVK